MVLFILGQQLHPLQMKSERSFNLTFPSISVGSLQGNRVEQTQSWFSQCRDFHMKKGHLPQINILKEGCDVMELDGFRIYNSEKNFRKDWVQVPPFADGKSEHKREGETGLSSVLCIWQPHITWKHTLLPCTHSLREEVWKTLSWGYYSLRKPHGGLPWWPVVKTQHCQCRGWRSDPW